MAIEAAFKSAIPLLIYSSNTNQFTDGGPSPLSPSAADSPLLHQSALPFAGSENGEEAFPVLFSARRQ